MIYPKDFIAFGTQYYRCPTPLEKDWERDLKAIADAGFNTVKIWAQWRSNCRGDGVYDFGDVVRLMDICESNNLRVIVNVIFDGAPTWFNARYPDCNMITASGRVMHPQTVAYRQVGGAPGPCYHHAQGRKARADFMKALAREIGAHPTLLIWDLWNEPELTVGILREPIAENLLCYCDDCRAAFIEYLRGKYGTVEALNGAWHGEFGAFEHVEMPRDRGVFKPMVDFRTFFADVMANELKLRADAVKSVDDLHPVMVHTVPLPHFNLITTGSDDYKLAKLCDMYGCSIGSEPFAAAVTTSAAPCKIALNSEIHAIGGSTYARPRKPSLTEFKRHIFTPLARGIRGFQFWQYRAEILGQEAPAWGLTDLRGRAQPQLGYAKQVNCAIQKRAEVIANSAPAKSRIAVINSGKNQIFDWCSSGSIDLHYQSVRGIFDALHARNYMLDIISEEQTAEMQLDQYKLICAPFPYYMDAKFAARMREWVRGGGHLFGEVFFGGIKDEDGYHSEILPGYGFDKVFGCEEISSYSVQSFRDAYSSHDQIAHNRVDIVPLSDGERLSGANFRQSFEITADGAVTLATFEDGGAAVVQNAYGQGIATAAGTLLGYHATPANGDFLSSLAEMAGVAKTAQVPSGIRVDVLYRDDEPSCVIIANDGADDSQPVSVIIDGLRGHLTNAMTNERIAVSPDGAPDGSFAVKIARGDIDLFYCGN